MLTQLHELIDCLHGQDIRPSGEELADVLWLALRMEELDAAKAIHIKASEESKPSEGTQKPAEQIPQQVRKRGALQQLQGIRGRRARRQHVKTRQVAHRLHDSGIGPAGEHAREPRHPRFDAEQGLLTRAPQDLGTGTALGIDMFADSLQEELVTISDVPMIIVSQASPG